VAVADALTQMPTARLSWSGGKAARSRARVLGRSRAPKAPLDPPEEDDAVDGPDQPDGQGAEGEADHPDEEDQPPTEPAAELSSEDQQYGDDQKVGVGHPLQLGQRGVQVLADVGVGHGHHRPVDPDHDHAQRHADQGQPGIGA